MQLLAIPMGAQYHEKTESDIVELSFGISGLRVVVSTQPVGSLEDLYIEFFYDAPRGFRFLDEGDLIRYWESKEFVGNYHLFEITAGGWKEQEIKIPGMLSVTDGIGQFREWFIATTNNCMNVLSISPPLVREFK